MGAPSAEAPRFEFGSLIGGDWNAADGAIFETRNPAHPERIVGVYRAAPEGFVAVAMEAARSAQADWARRSTVERGERVERWLDEVERRADAIVRATVLEQGKPVAEARAELAKAISEARTMIGMARGGAGEVMAATRPGFLNLVVRRPRGVILAICPWNFPIMTPLRKLAPALVYGNAVILKPSQFTPAAAALLADAARETLPAGLVQVLNGDGAIGGALAASPGIDGITFTGAIPTGRRIFASAAASLAELSLELGGKNAAIVNDPPDLEVALDQIAAAAFAVCGQRCTAISRIVVRRTLHDAVAEGLGARAKSLRLGDGLQPGVTTGPLIHEAHRRKVAGMVARAQAAGATAICGAREARPDSAPDGFFYEPTVLTGVTGDMEIAREEVFGPVLTLQPYDDFEEALTIVNGVEHGLTAALFTNDQRLVQTFMARCQTGMMHINHGTVPDNNMPFGGVKSSGVGVYSSVGPSAIQFYTTEHSVYIAS